MKAWVLHGRNDLRFEDVKEPTIAENEVRVKVKAVGICGSDVPRIYRTGAHVHPLMPGHEFAGIVTETGAAVDCAWLGKRVGVFPLIPCKKCIPCQEKQYEMCRHYSYLGSRRDGGFAEYVAVPVDNLIELPPNVSFEEGAMLEPMAVAVHAMRRIVPGEKDIIAVCGLGTIGLLLVMFLWESGIRNLLVIGNKDFQKRTFLKMGLPERCYCDSKKYDVGQWLMEHSEQKGVDAFFECVGKNETLVQAIDNTAPAGRICLIGNPYSDMQINQETYWKILRNQLTVMGTWNSSFLHEQEDDWNYVIKRLSLKRIAADQLISHRFPLEKLEQGLRIMRDKKEDYIKIMGIVN